MQLKKLNGAYQATDLDLYKDEDSNALGREVAEKCVVFVDQKLSMDRLWQIHENWGSDSPSIIHMLTFLGKLKGPHWNSARLNIMQSVNEFEDKYKHKLSTVTYQKNKKGRPQGIFTNGKLGWHSDQVTLDDSQRVIGLYAVEHTEGSQTAFLCTAEAYDKLNHEDKTMVDELKSVYKWNVENFTGDLIPEQKQLVRMNQVPLDGMSCSLKQETAAGTPGVHFPGSLFSHFMGMEKEESVKFKEHIWDQINKDEYIYTHDWKDGQVVFMDQNITLHARPTDVKDGNQRKMWRCISYMDNLFPGNGHNPKIVIDGVETEMDTFVGMVDDVRRNEYQAGKRVGI